MSKKPKKHISLKDLASELDISISTVSRALKDHPNISEEVKTRVRELAEEWDYRPNPLAIGLLRENTRSIGVIVPDLVTHFFSSVISGIDSYARKKGHYIIIASSYENLQKEKDSIENLLNSRVEGLIISLSYQTDDHSHFEELHRKGIPMVFFDRVCLSDSVSSVVADNREASANITRHFGAQGYRRIAFISGPPALNISEERTRGYLEGLEELEMPFRNAYLEHCEMEPGSAGEATRRLLGLPEPPDAIFGINDTVAFAAMKEIRRQGLQIPGDVGIVGFTDDYHSTVVHPTLSSVSHPTREMGREAARLLFDTFEGKPPEQLCLRTQLIARESSKGPESPTRSHPASFE